MIRCWDKDWTTSNGLGMIKIKMGSLMINGGIVDSYDLINNNKPTGSIKIESVFEPKDGEHYEE